MKIKIITIHNIPNFGSIFQCYALCEYLKKINFNDVEVIDYNPSYFKSTTLKSKIAKILNYKYYLNRKNKFENFIKKNIPVTKKSFSSLLELKDYNFDADLYISGGDQLWNVYHDSGKDDVYRLVWTKGRKISYGTSMGQSDFPKKELRDLANKISDYSHVGVRESSSVVLLKTEGVKAVHCVDPVFLLTKDDYSKFFKNINQPKYLLVYLVTPSPLLEKCIDILSKYYKLKVILCSGFSKKCTCDEFIKDLGPDEILSYIKNAEIVLSSSFHATAFSLLFKKQFFTILPDKHTNERIEDLLRIRGLSNRIITNESDLIDELYKNIDYENTIDYEKYIENSKFYLRNAINYDK